MIRVGIAIVCVVALSGAGHAQSPSAQANLAEGISQAKAGDFYRALLILNDVVSQSSNDTATLARAQAFRAFAFLGLDQPERAKASVLLALKADPNITINSSEFGPAVVTLFADVRRPATGNPETQGQAAERAGQFQDAFLLYLSAFQALPDPPPAADDQRLREKIITTVKKSGIKPVIPPEAAQHFRKAEDLLTTDAALGNSGGASTQQAVAKELQQSVRIAPWWPDPLVKLAQAQQKLQRVDEAVVNLNLYRLADPEGYAALTRPAAAVAAPSGPAELETARPSVPGVLYIYYPPIVRTMGIKPKTQCDGHHVADLESGHYVKLNVGPGNHTIKVMGEETSVAVEAGRMQYIKYDLEGYPAHFRIHLKSPEEGAEDIRKKGIVPNDPKRTFSADCSAAPATPGRPRG